MARGLGGEIRQRRPFTSPAVEAFLNLQRTAHLLGREHARFFRPYGITPTQYNALRILRGSHPEPLACGEVGARMVTPVPDVTRLLGRLELRGLVRRRRDGPDRRVVAVGITAPGLELLGKLDGPVASWMEARLGRVEDRRLRELSRLLAALRRGPDPGRSPG